MEELYDNNNVQHIEVDQLPRAEGTENPQWTPNITVSIPETIDVKMVQATALSEYEEWFLMFTISCTAFFTFLALCIQSKQFNFILTLITIIFGGFFIYTGYRTFRKRQKLTSKSRTFTLRTTTISEKDETGRA
jgi:uncharacterized membrane protein